MEKIIEKSEQYILYILLFIIPISAFAISPNPYVVSKLAILTYGVGILLLIKALKTIYLGKMDYNIGKYDLPVAVIALSYIISTFLRTPNKMEALLLPGTTTIIVGGALLYYLLNQYSDKVKRNATVSLFLSAAVFAFITLLAFTGALDKIPQLPGFVRSRGFTPEGGFLPAVIFLATILPAGLGLALGEKHQGRRIIYSIAVAFIIFGLGIAIYNLLPGRPYSPRFPSLSVSWAIAIDSLKTSPILGVGPGNYLTAFNRFRTLAYNITDLWSVKFATASNFYLTVLAETGLLGLAGFVSIVIGFYKSSQKELREKKLVHWGFAAIANVIALSVLLVAYAVFPATALSIILLFIFLSFNAATKATVLNLTTKATGEETTSSGLLTSHLPSLIITLPVIVLVGFVFFRTAKILQAEYKFKKSLDAIAANDTSATYSLMSEAIKINPFVDRYHATFTRINLLLANAVAKKQNLSDQDRADVTKLIQQTIAEGKATVALNPLRAGNWEVLARTYQSIIPFAQGADSFAIQSFGQAIALDPLNPTLRISLGGIYYARKDYNNAVGIFNIVATQVKPDLANAHYNLAFALKEKGEIDAAVREMSTVLSMIKDKNSQDYAIAKQTLEDLQGKQRELKKQNSENLTAPESDQSSALNPKLDLPQDSQPPEAPISPTPTEAPIISTSVTPTP